MCCLDGTCLLFLFPHYRYFHKEIKRYLEGGKVLSVFEETETPGVFKLKDYISLHLYLSQPPVGDYRECLSM